MDGDGYSDVFIGARGDNGALLMGSSELSGTVNHAEIGTMVRGRALIADGQSHATIGDAVGDGVPDLAIALGGRVYVFRSTLTERLQPSGPPHPDAAGENY